MGRVRTKFIKRAAIQLIEKYGPIFTSDFETNKQILNEVAVFPSKKIRNKVAGYITKLVKTGRAREIWLLRRKAWYTSERSP